jgi:hypothetical protein
MTSFAFRSRSENRWHRYQRLSRYPGDSSTVALSPDHLVLAAGPVVVFFTEKKSDICLLSNHHGRLAAKIL